jgi:multidrug efflux pump
MFSKFFIDRPIFAWVIALFISILGALAITKLPVAQYPTVAPPSILINANYPGASAQVLEQSVLAVIEQEMNGAPGLIYMESAAQANGLGTITITFDAGTNIDLAQVEVQNRLARATPRLPASVTQQGVRIDKARSNFLMVGVLISANPADAASLGDYAARNVMPELLRVPGVGQAQLLGSERAMRIWVDPVKLQGYGLGIGDVTTAIRAQNAQVAAGALGDLPAARSQVIAVTVIVKGQLENQREFGDIALRTLPSGAAVRLKDVARIELGAQSYAMQARLNGQSAVAIGVQLSPSANAMATSEAIRKRMGELAPFFPEGVRFVAPFDTSRFVKLSIEQVLHTLAEAMVLVFLVMWLFLQSARYTLIPAIVVPVALLGTCAVMLALGFSINVLTMFGMVLAIGILVDDAIVVVENVERLMNEEGLRPREATIKAMGQITGAVIGITVVLVAVFLPLAFFGGSVGNIYKQFSVALVVSILFSVLLALTLTPALCASFLKPVTEGSHAKTGFFGAFNRGFDRLTRSYRHNVRRLVGRGGRMMALFAVMAVVAGWMYVRLPLSFLPAEDQGYVIANVQLPPAASAKRTDQVIEQVERYFLAQPEVANIVTVRGTSFSGQGQNVGVAYITLKDWGEREGAQHNSTAVAQRAFMALSGIRDAFVLTLNPPPIPELANATGFSFRLQDRAGLGHEALLAARNQLLGLATQSELLAGVRPDGLEDAPQLQLVIDRERAQAQGVSFDAINTLMATAMGSVYANDFPNQGRLQRVIVQADAAARMQPDDLLALKVPNSRGEQVAVSSFATTRWTVGPAQAIRYNGYPAMKLAGDAAPGRSTGEAMAEMERLVRQLPPGFGFEWTGQSREEKLSGSQATYLLAFSMLAVFLCLAALYESWSIPVAVLLIVPLGVLGALIGVNLRGMPNDVYFKVGLITVIGLAAKNAILIVEFAKDLQAEGRTLIEAAIEAARLRLRPILMTSLAFILGVLPLAVASGAGSASQRAIGTGVMAGMIAGTVLAVFFVPVFYVVVSKVFHSKSRAPHGTAISDPRTLAADAEDSHGKPS